MKFIKICTFIVFIFSGMRVWALEVGDTLPCINLTHAIDAVGLKGDECLTHVTGEQEFALLDFMSITCAPCLANLPVFKNLSLDLQAKVSSKLVIVDKNQNAVDSFIKSSANNLVFPIALDNEKIASKAVHLRFTPTTFLVNKEGKILYKHIGGPYTETEINEIKSIVQNNSSVIE